MSVICKRENVKMKKLSLALLIVFAGLFCGCTSENSSDFSEEGALYSGSIEGLSQKGPLLTGASVTVQELEGTQLLQTGKSFKGKIINDKGEFLVDNVDLDYPYVLLEANGYFRNEVTGKKSNGSIIMRAIADVSDRFQVNINLLTHLEYERVQVLMKQEGMSIADAKRQADHEILSAFFELNDYEMAEDLDIFGNREGDAALLAINILLLANNGEGDFMERFALLDQDLADDGLWNDSLLKAKIADDACKVDLMTGFSRIRKNMEDWKISENIAPFESYVRSFWEKDFGLGKCDASLWGKKKKNTNEASSFYGIEFICDSLGRWNADIEAVVAGCDSCGFVTDERDGRVYRTVKMAGLKWTSENLKFLDDGIVVGAAGAPKCYRGDCETYGYYYKVIGDLCPDGWRLPTSEEFNRLLEATSSDGYKELFSKTGWNGIVGSDQNSARFATSTVAVSCKWNTDCRTADYFVFNLSENVDSIKVKTSSIDEFYVRCVEGASAEQKKTLLGNAVGTYKDERDGTIYNTVTIGDQVWFMQNMNYVMYGSVCIDGGFIPARYKVSDEFIGRSFMALYEKKDSCRLGLLYTESASQSVCPDGWRLPTKYDVSKLGKTVEGTYGVRVLFNDWIPNQNDIYEKYAMVTEYDYARFWMMSKRAHFWTSEPHASWNSGLSFTEEEANVINPVRCMKDLYPSNKKSSSSMAPVSSSSSPESSSSDDSTMECNAENEGLVKTEWAYQGSPLYRYMGYETYFKCESGAWVEKDVRVTCDTAGVTVGAVCTKMKKTGDWVFGYKRAYFIYEGNGVWADFKDLGISKECTDANEGSFEVASYGNETGRVVELFKCHEGNWVGDLPVENYRDYFCASKNDSCTFYFLDEKRYYRYFVYDEEGNGGMTECSYDAELGYCPVSHTLEDLYRDVDGTKYHCNSGKWQVVGFNDSKKGYCPIDSGTSEGIYREVDGINYHCSSGKWQEVSFIPRQLTDPRKDGLTDDEYDMLDLPRNSTVGDVVGGLMENCVSNRRFEMRESGAVYDGESYPAYDYCVSRNYYQYQEDGSWKLMTNEDIDRLMEANDYNSLCRLEIEGKEILVFPYECWLGKYRDAALWDRYPSATYKCVSGDWELVEYHFSRYKKK